MNQPYYVAIDPGKHTGVALFNASGEFFGRYVLEKEELFALLSHSWQGAETIILENFRLFPTKNLNMIMNTFDAVAIKGAVELACYRRGWELVLQEPSVRHTAEKWLGWNYKSHTPDDKAAHAHGVKYLVSNHIITIDKAISDKEHYEARNKAKKNVGNAKSRGASK